MARHDDASTYADLLARLGDAGTKELFRRVLEDALQELIEAELTAHSQFGGSEVRFIGRRHGLRSDRRWAKSWSPEQIPTCRFRLVS